MLQNYDLCFLLSFFSGTEESIVVEIWVLLKFILFVEIRVILDESSTLGDNFSSMSFL
jgi:hypothetical protein